MTGRPLRRAQDWIAVNLVPEPVWRAWCGLRHPVYTFYSWRHSVSFPVVGERITYHDKIHTVIGVDAGKDEVQIDTGAWVSWTNCCDTVRHDPRTNTANTATTLAKAKEEGTRMAAAERCNTTDQSGNQCIRLEHSSDTRPPGHVFAVPWPGSSARRGGASE